MWTIVENTKLINYPKFDQFMCLLDLKRKFVGFFCAMDGAQEL